MVNHFVTSITIKDRGRKKTQYYGEENSKEAVQSSGIEPNWGCWDFREGSAELASKLGFVEVSRDVVFGVKGIQ